MGCNLTSWGGACEQAGSLSPVQERERDQGSEEAGASTVKPPQLPGEPFLSLPVPEPGLPPCRHSQRMTFTTAPWCLTHRSRIPTPTGYPPRGPGRKWGTAGSASPGTVLSPHSSPWPAPLLGDLQTPELPANCFSTASAQLASPRTGGNQGSAGAAGSTSVHPPVPPAPS